MIILYNLVLVIGISLGFPVILFLALASNKRRKTFLHRLGFRVHQKEAPQNGFRLPENRPLWVHALSVGEVFSAVPLVEGLKNAFSRMEIVFSVSTQTGFEIAQKLLGAQVRSVVFFPYDLPFSIRRVAGSVDPALVMIVETDIWPNFLREMKKRNVPVVLANARLSKKSFLGYRRLGWFLRPWLLTFAKVCAQSVEDAQRFKLLGIPTERVVLTGNVKFDQRSDPLSEDEARRLRQRMGVRSHQKILLAGSTHKGEEAVLLEAYCLLKKKFADLCLIVAPRDPMRAGSVHSVFKSAGYSAALTSAADLPDCRPAATGRTASDQSADVIVLGAIGILRKLYALADVAFIGGSLVNCGGHNPLEPAAFSRPILFGPHMSDFLSVSRMLVQDGGAVQVHDAADFDRAVAVLLEDPEKAKNLGQRAFNLFCAHKGAVEKTLAVVEEALKK